MSSHNEYRNFFMKAMEKFNINSPADLKSDEQKKKFFNYVDRNWSGKTEEAEMYVDEIKEANAFLKARAVAIWEDREEFEFNGKIYPVIKVQEENLREADDTPFSASELGEIEDATKKMIDHTTNPRKSGSYDFFTFKNLKKYVNKDYPEVSYDFSNRRKGEVQVLWGRYRGKVTCSYSVAVGDADMDTEEFDGRTPKDCLNSFMRTFR